MSKLKKEKTPFETYYSKIISQPVVNACPYHKPFTAAYLYILSACYYFSDIDNSKCEENTSAVLIFLEKEKFTDEEMSVFHKSVLLFSKVMCKEIATRGDWFIYDCSNDNILQGMYLCFGDLISNPDCINDYVNAPAVRREMSDQVVFAVEFDEVFCLTVEYTNLL